ncbi:hypothetical protein [Micromonospora sp. NPDC005806]|uniref:hypothetical protein n=1 Tax=Micromonospora sp. NPDC005806 TaxID=3364234 RepID=UPI0036D00613
MTSGIPCAVAGLGFFVDVVAGGAVAGIGSGDDLGTVAARLGENYVDDRDGNALRRDYGLVEFYWDWSTAADRWTLTGFQVEVYRLAYGRDVPARLGERYQFASRVSFERLRMGVEGLGLSFEEITTDADLPDYRRFWCAETGISVVVLAMASPDEPHEPGDVWSIQPEWRGIINLEGDENDRRSTTDGLAHLLHLELAMWPTWLQRLQACAVDANWWLHLYQLIDVRIRSQSDRRAEWAARRLWLMRQAVSRGVFGAAETAVQVAAFVGSMVREVGWVIGLPTADDVVSECLAALPTDPDIIRLLGHDRDLRSLTIDELRASRQAKNLINAAAWYLEAVEDLALAERLRGWLAIKHQLV